LKDFIGKPLNADKLDPALTQLTGSGRYNTLDYRIVDREGKQGLLIIVKEKILRRPRSIRLLKSMARKRATLSSHWAPG